VPLAVLSAAVASADAVAAVVEVLAVLVFPRPFLGIVPRVIRLSVLCLAFAGMSCKLHEARQEISAKEAFDAAMRRVKVKPPAGEPEVSQASIDLALAMFGIDVPSTAQRPRLDPELRDRGLTVRAAFMDKAEVTVGPAAFASWGLLGSTLAHELEVHCRQNFLFISVMDGFGLDGTGEAERQAYIHELRNAKRFGLAGGDAELIADTMEYYYPEGRKAGPAVALKRWLARNLMRNDGRF
jgi:hypothetical protein